jgi:RNA polymerase sigma-70 factor (ECF subfamily)
MALLDTPRRPAARDPDVCRMLRVQRGEPGAFAELVERYWGPIVGRFFRQLGDRQEAEDLAQDVFLRLYRARHRYQPSARFSTWLFHIAANVARNALRSRRRRPCKPLGLLAGAEGDDAFAQRYLPDRREGPTQPLERAELTCQVRHALSGLGDRQRAALELQFQDRTYQEIASRLAMTPKAAKSLLYRARQQLRETLGAVVE